MPPLTLELVDPRDDKALADVLALEEAARAVDRPQDHPPTPTAGRAFRQYGWDSEPGQEWLCRSEQGEPIGQVGLYLPHRDNRRTAFGGVLVHPAQRRQGLGRQLADQLRTRAAQPGRRALISGSLDHPAERAFATQLGFTQASVDVLRRQDLTAVDWPRIGTLRAEARAAAHEYTLLRFTGPVPDELVDEVAVMEAAINDAPRDNLAMEDEAITAARVRARDRSLAAAQWREFKLIAQRRRDGALAGHTVVFVDPEQPTYGNQGDTSVLAAHRGHRLGMLLKSEMMHWLAEAQPQLRWVDTGNAESNRHMIAINEALGYQIKARQISWQRDL